MHEKSIKNAKLYKGFAGADAQGEFDYTICHFSSELKELGLKDKIILNPF